jgi:arylsulfatase A-like enzyme
MNRALTAPLLTILLFPACIASDGSTPDAPGTARSEPPNILIFLTDDQRGQGTLGVMPETSRLFEEQGVRFTDAYTTTPFCCPARVSIMTGRYAHNHNVLLNMERTPGLDQQTTLQHYLQEAGYRTAIFGKYLNAWDLSADPPHFDEWAIFAESEASGYVGGRWNVDGEMEMIPSYETDYLARRSISFVRSAREAGSPWALIVSTSAPHRPFTVQPKYRGAPVRPWAQPREADETGRRDKPPYVQDRNIRRSSALRVRAGQLRTLMSVDDLVHRLFSELGKLEEEDNTLAFFLSDNGFMWGEHGLVGKLVPYTPSVRIPLLVRWPARLSAGTTDDRLAATIDVAPTVLDAAGIEPETEMDGKSLLDEWERDRLLVEFWNAFRHPTWAGTITRAYQYVEYYKRDARTKTFTEYYDLVQDPWQNDNLLSNGDSADDPDTQALARTLAADRECAGGGCP